MKNKHTERIIQALIITSTVVASFFLGGWAKSIDYSAPWSVLGQPNFNEISCANLTLEQTAKCLQDEQSKWYNYNLSNINKTLTLDELKEKGGVCRHYSKWYYDNFKRLGFNAKQVVIHGSSNGHVFTIAWDNTTSYCILDQIIEVKCVHMR